MSARDQASPRDQASKAAAAVPAAPFTVEVPDGVLAGDEAGSGEPVVLIHGFSFDRAMWDPQWPVLARSFRAIRYDLRGFGSSTPPAAGQGHVGDLLALLDDRGAERAHLVGLSLGANIALAAAALHQDRVASVVLASPGLPGYQWTTPRPPDEAAAVARRDGIEAARRWWLGHEIFRSAERYPAARRRLHEMVGRFPAYQWAGGPAAEPLPPLAGYLPALPQRVLILNGAHDAAGYREIATALAAAVPRAERQEFADAGHLLNLEQPERFNHRLLTFLTNH